MNLEDSELYMVRNKEGLYFRAKGYGGYGPSWVEDINRGKIYTKIGTARGRVTWFAKNHPSYGIPDIIRLIVTRLEVINEEDRVVKAIETKKKREKQREVNYAKKQVEAAKLNLERLER